ncbi:MAG: cysteine-rich CWC family protein [Gammaproteobacteria bacterium]|nr:cysteine-rich CWC family protein [Gammaproteobacteria bacterium]
MKHELKTCPRCRNEFECKLGNILQCQCADIELSDGELETLNNSYDDCLCADCLSVLQREMRQSGQGQAQA